MYRSLKKDPAEALTDKLLECEYMANENLRASVISRLEGQIRNRIESKGSPKADVLYLVKICIDYERGLEKLIEALGFFERDSIPMKGVIVCYKEYFLPTGSQKPPPGTISFEIDELLTEGRELHWDRETVVRNFVGMVKREGGKRFLVIQGSKDAGLDTLVQRLSRICTKKTAGNGSSFPIIHKEISLGAQKEPIPFINKILNTIKNCCDDCGYIRLSSKADETIDSIAEMKNASNSAFAKKLNEFLCQAAQTCTVVLLLTHFENLEGCGLPDGFLNEWLNNCPPREKGLVIVLTGEKGLSDRYPTSDELENILASDTLDFDYFKTWAREGYKFTENQFSDEGLKQVYEEKHHKVALLGEALNNADLFRKIGMLK